MNTPGSQSGGTPLDADAPAIFVAPPTLLNCADEPIHIPGTVQAHGAMLVFDADGLLEAWSENVPAMLQLHPALGQTVRQVSLPAPVLAMVESCLVAIEGGDAFPLSREVDFGVNLFDCIVHAHGGRVLVEFEQREMGLEALGVFALKAHNALDRLKRQKSLAALLQMATEQVRDITGFDRVMGYRFRQDGSGDVVAEARSMALTPFLGLRYPASDIPAQARRLYVMNSLRLIPDLGAPAVALVGREGAAAVDMSHSVLRSVSPVHIEYLQNMGVAASMSISIVVDGQLWGLIACHHRSPKQVPYSIRMTTDVIAQILAASVQTLEAHARTVLIERAANVRTALMQTLLLGEDTLREVARHAAFICAALDASALIVVQSGRHLVHGGVDAATAQAIVKALPAAGETLRERVRVEDWPLEVREQIKRWPGMLAMCFDPSNDGWVLALRPEQVAAVRWGGRPDKIVAVGPLGARLTPRGSFEEWRETVRGSAEAWSPTHLLIAGQMQDELHRASIARHGETDRARAHLMAMLGHDLRDPLHTIQMAAAVMERSSSGPAPLVRRIQSSSDRMSRLIGQVLDVSKIESTVGLGIARTRLDLAHVVNDVVDEARHGYPELDFHLSIVGPAIIDGDADRMAQVVANLLGNARAHGQMGEPIRISLRQLADQVVLVVNNVAGPLGDDAIRQLYTPFKEASQAQSRNRGGMGLGLYIVDRIVAGHDGTIVYSHAEGRVNFTVSLASARPA
ncbi:ATP-binding protein [Massilia sp. S19_KUP03_FR1]|uniref:ATP-binding protein n=1 Tax=Massilia sp. S19_KUP03_FR1 TaxID=3025503 RepID=UPI002FCD9D7A